MVDLQYYLQYIAKEQEGFRKVLHKYFKKTQIKNPKILNICCGIANEEPLLNQYFGEGTQLVGLDHREDLEELRENLKRKSVKIGDIRELKKYVRGKFDIVLGRNIPLNPNNNFLYRETIDYWPDIFENLINYMKSNSTLFITLAREDEFNRAKEILKNLEYKINIQEKNPIPVQSDYIGVAGADTKDNHVVIAEPPLQQRLFKH